MRIKHLNQNIVINLHTWYIFLEKGRKFKEKKYIISSILNKKNIFSFKSQKRKEKIIMNSSEWFAYWQMHGMVCIIFDMDVKDEPWRWDDCPAWIRYWWWWFISDGGSSHICIIFCVSDLHALRQNPPHFSLHFFCYYTMSTCCNHVNLWA